MKRISTITVNQYFDQFYIDQFCENLDSEIPISFLNLERHKMYSKLGYAVVAFDNRGSAGRSLYFQGQIKGQLGEVEVSDQIAGIDYVSREFGVIDTKRIAIEGWSYGGFMSLMALAKRSDVFKVRPRPGILVHADPPTLILFLDSDIWCTCNRLAFIRYSIYGALSRIAKRKFRWL